MTNKVYGLMGFAAKSRKIAFGTDSVIECIELKKAKIVIVATDASDKTKKNIQFICNKYHVDCFIYGEIEEMSQAIGKTNKAVFAIKDRNLADGIRKIINGGEAIG